MKIGGIFKRTVNRVSPLVLALAIVFVAIGSTTAVAITLTDASPTEVSMFGSDVEDSDFNLNNMDSKVRGASDKVSASVELQNTAETTESAEVLIQSVDSSGNVVAEETVDTGDVEAGGTWSGDVTLEEDGLSDDHSRLVITVNQHSN